MAWADAGTVGSVVRPPPSAQQKIRICMPKIGVRTTQAKTNL